MEKKNVEIVCKPSLIPYMIAGAIYIVGTFLLPMYKLSSYIILICLSFISYIVIKKLDIFKDQTVEIEKKIVYESEEQEEICRLGYEQIEALDQLTLSIDNLTLIQNIKDIKETSLAILKLVEDDSVLVKKVNKYFRYYLSEIIQLIKQYDEFEEDPFHIENVKNSKEKIEATVGNANKSFLKFYNDLYEGKAMDINVDLKVFDSMLKKLD